MAVTLGDVKRRLAQASAHGTRQKMFVNELLAGPVEVIETPNIYARGGLVVVRGESRLSTKNWLSLKRRLAENGFVIGSQRVAPQKRLWTMIFREEING